MPTIQTSTPWVRRTHGADKFVLHLRQERINLCVNLFGRGLKRCLRKRIWVRRRAGWIIDIAHFPNADIAIGDMCVGKMCDVCARVLLYERGQGRSALFGAQRATKAPAEHAVCGNVFFSDYKNVLKITRTQDWLLSSDGCEDLDERAGEICDVCARVLLYERREGRVV